jgi:hypothetical protein
MEMRRRMITEKELDYDSVEPCDLRHMSELYTVP